MTKTRRKSKTKKSLVPTEVVEMRVPPKLSSLRIVLVGAVLVVTGMLGFYFIPGLIVKDAKGDRIIISFYCTIMTLTTVGYGDVCPGDISNSIGHIFLLVLPLFGLGFFCGPVLSLASSWQSQVGIGVLSLGVLTLALGVSILIVLEGMSLQDAIHLSIISGTTIGFGNITPTSDVGRFAWAMYVVVICNIFAGLLDHGRLYLESFCHERSQSEKKVKELLKNNKEILVKKEE